MYITPGHQEFIDRIYFHPETEIYIWTYITPEMYKKSIVPPETEMYITPGHQEFIDRIYFHPETEIYIRMYITPEMYKKSP